jgi:hypothetical protein
MAALNVTMIGSAALHPAGRGQIERLVGTVKIMLKKMLSVQTTLNWEYLPYLCAKIINSTVSPKTGFTPQAMVFGTVSEGQSMLSIHNLIQPHHMVMSNKQHIEDLNKEIKTMVELATDKLKELRIITNERLNKNRVERKFKPNDYVFVLDRLQVPGSARPLKTKFHPSPYVVIKTYATTTLVKRLADGFQSCYSNDDLKRYDATSPLFKDLPPEVSKVLLHDFRNLLNADLCTLTKYDALGVPDGLELFDPVDNTDINQTMVDNGEINIFDNVRNEHVQDEFEPESNTSKWEDINNSLATKLDVPPIPDTVGLPVHKEPPDEEEQQLIAELTKPGREQLEELTDLHTFHPDLNIDSNAESESEEEVDELPDIPQQNVRTLRNRTVSIKEPKQKSHPKTVTFENA